MLGTHNLLAGAQPGATFPERHFGILSGEREHWDPRPACPWNSPSCLGRPPPPTPGLQMGCLAGIASRSLGRGFAHTPQMPPCWGKGGKAALALRPQMGRYVNRLFWKESGRRLQLSGLAPDHSTQLKIPASSPGPLEGSLPVLEVPHSVVLIITALYLLTFGGFFAIKVLHATYKNHNGHSRPLGAHPGPRACMELTSFFPFLSLFPQQLRKSGKSVHLI